LESKYPSSHFRGKVTVLIQSHDNYAARQVPSVNVKGSND